MKADEPKSDKPTLSQEDKDAISKQAEDAVNMAYDIDYPYEKMWIKGYESGAEWATLRAYERIKELESEIEILKKSKP